jgi:hypothetical protein
MLKVEKVNKIHMKGGKVHAESLLRQLQGCWSLNVAKNTFS